MIKAIIIEDELNARAGLIKMLNILDENIIIVAETGKVNEAIKLIEDLKPNLIFLDIELEDGNGFEILNRVEEHNFKVIFTTAYSEYAVKAFKYSTVDYLLKPIDPFDLKNSIEKATKILKVDKEYKEMLGVLNHNLNENEKKIVLKTSEKSYVFNISDIIRLEADGAYTIFKTTTEKIIVSKNLKHYQTLLGDLFIRCHQSHLVNTKYIKALDKNNHLHLKNDDLVKVSSRKIAEVNQLIKSF